MPLNTNINIPYFSKVSVLPTESLVTVTVGATQHTLQGALAMQDGLLP